jgi:hypothetical protein
MANFYSHDYVNLNSTALARVTLGATDCTVEGSNVVFVVSGTHSAEQTVTVRDFDKTRLGCFNPEVKPTVLFKCTADCSVNHAVIKTVSGTTLFTFATDASATPTYCALRITDAGAWELA